MINEIIQKINNKNFTLRKFLSLSDCQKDFILDKYKKDFNFSSKLFFYEFIKSWSPYNFYCPECNKELTEEQVFRQYKSKGVSFCSNRCAQKSTITLTKISKKCLEKHGVLYTSQIPGSREKFKQTCLKRHGGPLLANKDIQNKVKQTCLERYGHEHWAKVKENVKVRNNIRKLNSNINYKILDNLKEYISNQYCQFQDFQNLLKLCNCSSVLLYRKLLNQNIITEGKLFRSRPEQEVVDFISDNFDFELKLNQLYFNIDLDIFIPEKKLAIEVNGDYWHSYNRQEKYKNHHLNKTNLCESKGIRLIHIWESEWLNNQEFIKELLSLYLDDKVHQNEFQKLLEQYEKLPRDYFQVLDFPDYQVEEPVLEKTDKFKVYKTGYILK